MGRFGFAIAWLASLVLLVAFVVMKSNAPGLSIGVALLLLPMFLTGFGFFKSTNTTVTKDAKGAAWAAVAISVLGLMYMAAFFISWIIFVLAWFAVHVVMIAFVAKSPVAE